MLSQLNKTYISDALADKLERITDNTVTAIIAPMGYGKTKVIEWWIARHSEDKNLHFFRQIITTDSLNDF